MSDKQIKPVDIEYKKYQHYILTEFLGKYGKSYDTADTLGNRWFHIYAYTAEREKLLIEKTLDYFWVYLKITEAKSFDPEFLEALAKRMADYLSEYTMKSGTHENRKAAKEALFNTFHTNNPYIKHVNKHNERKRQKAEKRKAKREEEKALKARPALKDGAKPIKKNRQRVVVVRNNKNVAYMMVDPQNHR